MKKTSNQKITTNQKKLLEKLLEKYGLNFGYLVIRSMYEKVISRDRNITRLDQLTSEQANIIIYHLRGMCSIRPAPVKIHRF